MTEEKEKKGEIRGGGGNQTVYLTVYGVVQGVMFRQTFLRACYKRHIVGGATNHPDDLHRVECSMTGDPLLIQEIIDKMKSGEKLNSHYAFVEKVVRNEKGLDPLQHAANTETVECDREFQGVNFYL